MSSNVSSSLNEKLLKHTSFFGIRLWVLLAACISLCLVLFLIFLSLCIIHYRRRKSFETHFRLPKSGPPVHHSPHSTSSSLDRRLLLPNIPHMEMSTAKPELHLDLSGQFSAGASTARVSNVGSLDSVVRLSPLVVLQTWRRNRFSLREIEVVTDGFANVIGNGDYGVVYRGELLDHTPVAVKKLSNKSYQSEDFIGEVEAIGLVRHKNLVRLLGYCMEEDIRILVYEYVDNGTLEQWLHGGLGAVMPLKWATRISIIQGVAKGLAYIHEDIEPNMVHRDIRSSNILLDHQWNPKISNTGLAKLVGQSHLTTHAIKNFGYVAQECASTGVLNEKSDIYSFGILVMEIISARMPVDHSQHQVYLLDWIKSMVANQKIEHTVDPKLTDVPSTKELKRVLLIALRCVDPDVKHRPKMGDITHMLEPHDLLLNEDRWIKRQPSHRSQTVVKFHEVAFRTDEDDINYNRYQKMMSK